MPATSPETCDKCGAEMDQERSWSRKSIPLIGSTYEYSEYLCPDCGQGARFKRKQGTEEWQRASA